MGLAVGAEAGDDVAGRRLSQGAEIEQAVRGRGLTHTAVEIESSPALAGNGPPQSATPGVIDEPRVRH